jgi:hypothetical protein
MVILDNLGIHTSKGSRLLRALLAEVGEDLMLVYTPTYDPDPTGWSGCGARCVAPSPHTHQCASLADLLSQIGSPFATNQQPTTVRNSAMQHEFPGSI